MLDSPVQYRRSVRLLMVSGLRPKDVCMCVRTRREDVSVSHWVGFGEVLTFGLFLFLRYCLFSILGLFMPPARNPSRLCVRRRSCSSHRADQRGWASLLGGEESEHKTLEWVNATMTMRLLLLEVRYLSSWPGLRVCVYPTPTRQALSTLACEKKQKHKWEMKTIFCEGLDKDSLRYVALSKWI